MAREWRRKRANKRCRRLSKRSLLYKRRGAEGCGLDAEPTPDISLKRHGRRVFGRLTPPPLNRILGVPDRSLKDIGNRSPMYNLLLQQVIDLQTRRLPEPGDSERQLLIVLDEFARLGRATMLAHGFSFVAGYGIRLLAVLQSPSQLREAYGDHLADEIIANCGAEVIFAPKDIRLAQSLSERLGYLGQRSFSRSRPLGLGSGRRSVSESEQRRPLMLPQELIALPESHLIVLRSGMAPVHGRKLRYYRLPAFMWRLRPPPQLKGTASGGPSLPNQDTDLGRPPGQGSSPGSTIRGRPRGDLSVDVGRPVGNEMSDPGSGADPIALFEDRMIHRR